MKHVKPGHIMAAAYVITVIGLVVYINISQSRLVKCLYKAQSRDYTVTNIRTGAADRKDKATIKRLTAMDQIVNLRLPDPTRYDGTIERLRRQHHTATQAEIKELRKVIAVRKQSKPPDVRRRCG